MRFDPLLPARDELRHAALQVAGAVVERDAEAADVLVARREEPLAQEGEAAVQAHDVEGVVGEVVLHCVVAELLVDDEELRLRAGRVRGRGFAGGQLGQPADGRGVAVPHFQDVREAHVVRGGARAPAHVDVARLEEVVEDFVFELEREREEAGCLSVLFAWCLVEAEGGEGGADFEDVVVCAFDHGSGGIDPGHVSGCKSLVAVGA